MIVVASKWGLDAAGNLDGGQNFFVNYNLGGPVRGSDCPSR